MTVVWTAMICGQAAIPGSWRYAAMGWTTTATGWWINRTPSATRPRPVLIQPFRRPVGPTVMQQAPCAAMAAVTRATLARSVPPRAAAAAANCHAVPVACPPRRPVAVVPPVAAGQSAVGMGVCRLATSVARLSDIVQRGAHAISRRVVATVHHKLDEPTRRVSDVTRAGMRPLCRWRPCC